MLPLQKVKIHKKTRKPWITLDLIHTNNFTNKLFKLFVKTKDTSVFEN